LVFLSMANRYSDTLAGLTDYLGVTKGTLSQTLKVLERRGLIRKIPDEEDGRITHCRLTSDGEEVVAQAYPAPPLLQIPDDVVADSVEALQTFLQSLQLANGARSFGVCASCRFYQIEGEGGRCGLTEEALTPLDSTKICREHEEP
jgi:MarR family transcriptional regulator, negative regulator of the multidrug operon emrRAB